VNAKKSYHARYSDVSGYGVKQTVSLRWSRSLQIGMARATANSGGCAAFKVGMAMSRCKLALIVQPSRLSDNEPPQTNSLLYKELLKRASHGKAARFPLESSGNS